MIVALHNPLRTLRHRDFRLLWSAEVSRSASQWMDLLVRGLLAWELTGSAAHLALITGVRAAPLVIGGLISGMLADRIDRKRLLLASQGINIAAHLAMALLVVTGRAELWHIYLTAVVVGFGMALNAPARQSLLPALVPARDLQSAVVLNTATLSLGQALGPAIGGVAAAALGLAGSFALQAVLLTVTSGLLRAMRVPPLPARRRESWARSAASGLRYLRSKPFLVAIFAVTLAPMVLVEPFRGVIPAIADEQLGVDAAATGLLTSSLGIGALLMTLLLASSGPPARPWRRIVVGTMLFGVAIAVFALSGVLMLSAAALFLAGIAQASFRTLSHSVQLMETDDAYRGRISSLWLVNRGLAPAGSALLAAVTLWWGVSAAMAALAGMAVLLVAAVAIAAHVRRRR